MAFFLEEIESNLGHWALLCLLCERGREKVVVTSIWAVKAPQFVTCLLPAIDAIIQGRARVEITRLRYVRVRIIRFQSHLFVVLQFSGMQKRFYGHFSFVCASKKSP